MSRIKKPKQAKLPGKPFKKEAAEKMGASGEERKLNKKMLKEAAKKKIKMEKTINRALGAAAVILCIISSVLDVIIKKADKTE